MRERERKREREKESVRDRERERVAEKKIIMTLNLRERMSNICY